MTVIELMIVVAIAAVLALIAAPTIDRWQRDQRVKGMARDVADVLLLARAEAARTGQRHMVVYGPAGTTDPSGTAIGADIAFVAHEDGLPAASNCSMDGGEKRESVDFPRDVIWGVSLANVAAPNDPAAAFFAAPMSNGGTTRDPANNAVQWLMFRPDGVPVRVEGLGGSCGNVGTSPLGGAAFYLTNGTRDYAVVLSPMGGVRVHVWNAAAGAWST